MSFADLLSVAEHRRADIARLATELKPGRRVALSTHINADGDGCGSGTALARLLAQLGMKPFIVNPTPWPVMYEFLLGTDVVNRTAEGAAALRDADVLLVHDISDVKRLGVLADTVRSLKIPRLVVDHHLPSDEPAGEITLDDTSACATGELVYDIAVTLGLEITPAVAGSLYAAILTDTGGFRFSNTTPRCHAIAAALLAAGVDPEEMYTRIYASAPIGRLQLLGEALETLGIDRDHGITWISVAAGALERHEVRSEDLDGIVEHARSVSGTRLALFFRDLGHGKVKVSFRSTGAVDVNAFARQFGGGGHAKASGALVAGTLEEVRERVVAAARAYLAVSKPARPD
ncbi:MAG: bifunctional oligoribonuclease/PAP phosphatase NrnA [Gemmatimonadaceae bacterium]|nr:bifunctional oligoribonuclease/PAP phosphatase NrnA [Gemmatimonadaceae bacterium]